MERLNTKFLITTSSLAVFLTFLLSKAIEKALQPEQGVLYFVINRTAERQQLILNENNDVLNEINFDPDASLFIIIHGYTESSTMPWIEQLVTALLEAEPSSTILIVDHWHLLCFARPIMNSNIHLIAKGVAGVLDFWTETSPLRMKKVHLIGFSLGGRIAGVVPHYLKNDAKIGRITGVDPSYPWTKTENTSEFLDSGDADLVVALRTSSVGFENPPVHIDFYVNNGILQPGCEAWYRLSFIEQICSHYKAPFLFVAAVKEGNKNSTSCKCQGKILPPNPKDCSCSITNTFGLDTNSEFRGVFHIQT